jgi:hypothetical protein
MLNPYAAFVHGREPLAVIAETPAAIDHVLAAIGPTAVDRSPAPGKWSPREIVAHLADTELVFAVRIRHALAEPAHVIQPFDQDDWARPYAAYDAPTAAATFAAVRRWNLALISHLTAADLARPVTHPERGTMTLGTIVETMAGHDGNHLRQLEAIAARGPSA